MTAARKIIERQMERIYSLTAVAWVASFFAMILLFFLFVVFLICALLLLICEKVYSWLAED